MISTEQRLRHRHSGFSWAPVLFLLIFLVILATIALWYIAPMLQAASHATTRESHTIKAYAALLLTLLLAVLLMGLVMTMRAGRAARMANSLKHGPTEYPDVWEESARRIKTPDPEELEGNDEGSDEPDTKG